MIVTVGTDTYRYGYNKVATFDIVIMFFEDDKEAICIPLSFSVKSIKNQTEDDLQLNIEETII